MNHDDRAFQILLAIISSGDNRRADIIPTSHEIAFQFELFLLTDSPVEIKKKVLMRMEDSVIKALGPVPSDHLTTPTQPL